MDRIFLKRQTCSASAVTEALLAHPGNRIFPMDFVHVTQHRLRFLQVLVLKMYEMLHFYKRAGYVKTKMKSLMF